MFAFGITSSDALEQLIQDILLNTEALGSTSGVTAANANISPHAASIRRAWHESVDALPRDELKSVVDNGLVWLRRSSAEAHAGDTKRATLGIPGKLTREIARLK